MTTTTTFTAIIVKEHDFFVAHCPQLGLARRGSTQEQAESNLKGAMELFLEDAQEDVRTIMDAHGIALIATIEVTV